MEPDSTFITEYDYLNLFENLEEEVHVYRLLCNEKGETIDLIFEYLNPSSIFNSFPKEMIIHKKASEVYKSPQTLQNHLKAANEASVDKNVKFEIYYGHLDKYYLIQSFLLKGSFVTIAKDITEEKKVKQRLKIASLIESKVKDAIIQLNGEDRIEYWNKGAETLFGYSLDEMKNRNLSETIDYIWLTPEDRKKALRQLKIKGEWQGENIAKNRDGREIKLNSWVKTFKNDKGNSRGTFLVLHDITGPTEIKKALEGNYKRLQEAQRIGKIGNWEWDINSNIITISDGLYRIYGIDPGKYVKYDTILGMVIPEDQQVIVETLEKALREHKPFVYDIKIRRIDGKFREISCHGEVITDFAGHPLKIICVEQDITKRKEIEYALWEAKNELESTVERRTRELNHTNDLLQNELERKKIAEEKLKKSEIDLKEMVEELKRSNNELQQFAYITSHDLQEPLRTIASFTQLIERRYKGEMDSNADEFIEYIVDATKRMQNLIKDLLQYSRVTTRGKEFKLTSTEEILQNTISNLKASIEESCAIISNDELPEIMADERQIGQLFQNLVSNAIKFKKPDHKPEIHISSTKEKDEYVFSFQDNGIGIEKQYFDRIFTIFQRLHTRDEYEGTGIGLSIAKKIVERHGGRIWVESEPRNGTTFYFTIPIED